MEPNGLLQPSQAWERLKTCEFMRYEPQRFSHASPAVPTADTSQQGLRAAQSTLSSMRIVKVCDRFETAGRLPDSCLAPHIQPLCVRPMYPDEAPLTARSVPGTQWVPGSAGEVRAVSRARLGVPCAPRNRDPTSFQRFVTGLSLTRLQQAS